MLNKPPTQGPQGAPPAYKLPLSGSENPGLFRSKAEFQYIHTKEVKTQDLLLIHPRNGGGEHSELGEGPSSIPGHGRAEHG